MKVFKVTYLAVSGRDSFDCLTDRLLLIVVIFVILLAKPIACLQKLHACVHTRNIIESFLLLAGKVFCRLFCLF